MGPYICETIMLVSPGSNIRSIAIMYHDVLDLGVDPVSGFPGPAADRYKLGREEFAKHLAAIHANAGDTGAILTFDDGGVSACDPVANLLEQYAWRGYFFIATDWIGRPGFLCETQIRELCARGHIIGSHSCSHPVRMSRLPRRELLREWAASAERLSGILQNAVTVASVPGGYSSQEVVATAAEAGITTIFTSEPTAAVRKVGACEVRGRYVVRRGMGEEWSAGFAAGKFAPCMRQSLAWRAKGLAKTLGGSAYLLLREAILTRPDSELRKR